MCIEAYVVWYPLNEGNEMLLIGTSESSDMTFCQVFKTEWIICVTGPANINHSVI